MLELTHMNCKNFRTCSYLLVVAGFLVLATSFSRASGAPPVSGSYQVVEKTNLGSQTRVRVQLHLTNHGQQALRIQRLTLWDLSHPGKGGTQACSIVIRAGGSTDTTQEFTIRRPEYEMWRRGTRPRLILEGQAPDGRKTIAVVRLDRASGGKAN